MVDGLANVTADPDANHKARYAGRIIFAWEGQKAMRHSRRPTEEA
jgi:hypothetical protein